MRSIGKGWIAACAALGIATATPADTLDIGFEPVRAHPVDFWPAAAAIGDVDEDGSADVIVSGYGTSNVYVFRGRGDGSLEEPTLVPTPTWHYGLRSSLRLIDVDGDGHLDLAQEGSPLHVLFGDGAGGFPSEAPLSPVFAGGAGEGPAGFGDWDGDGGLDVAVVPSRELRLAVSLGARTFAEIAVVSPISIPQLPGVGVGDANFGVADFDGDGATDLLVCSAESTRVYRNAGVGDFRLLADLTGERYVGRDDFAVFDMDGDGDVDVLRDDTWYLNDGSGAFVEGGNVLTPWGRGRPLTADLDGDGDLDVLFIHTRSFAFDTAASVVATQGAGAFSRGVPYDLPTEPMALGDLDGDGRADLVGRPYYDPFGESPAPALHVHLSSHAPPPSVSAVEPSLLTLPQTVDLTFVGEGFEPGATVGFYGYQSSTWGAGTVESVRVLSSTRLQARVAFHKDVRGGPQTFRVTNPDGKRWHGAPGLEVSSVMLQPRHGIIAVGDTLGHDRIRIRGRIHTRARHRNITRLLFGWGGDTRVTVSSPDGSFSFVVDTADPELREIGRRHRIVYRSPSGAIPRVRLALDVRRRRFSLRVKRASFVGLPENPIRLAIDVGGAVGSVETDWHQKAPGKLRWRRR